MECKVFRGFDIIQLWQNSWAKDGAMNKSF